MERFSAPWIIDEYQVHRPAQVAPLKCGCFQTAAKGFQLPDMPFSLTRKALFQGDLNGVKQAIRPPWALPEAQFLQKCNYCQACVRACPADILEAGRGGYPEVNFNRGECTFCGACAKSCRESAFVPTEARASTSRPWAITAEISDRCLSASGALCRICEEQCEARVISFTLLPGGKSAPRINSVDCSGCGACVAPCPAKAIKMG